MTAVERQAGPAIRIDMPIDVVPYPRVTVHLPRSRRGPSWTNNPDALAKLNAFYEEFGWRLAGTGAVHARIEGPLSVRIWIWKKSSRGDIDNLAKSVLDALTRYGVWLDDSQVKSLHVVDVERGAVPRLIVEIESIAAMLLKVTQKLSDEECNRLRERWRGLSNARREENHPPAPPPRRDDPPDPGEPGKWVS